MCRATDHAGWLSGPEVVCQAVQLILQGGLDEGREIDIARECGVSPRHLRRLFHDNLGITPSGLATARRVRCAQRLLIGTDLTVTEIAFRAGFGSVRQMNRVYREGLGASPLQLRRDHHHDQDRPDILTLRVRGGSSDWTRMLDHLARWAIPGVEEVSEGWYRRTITVDGRPGTLEMSPSGPGSMSLRLELHEWRDLLHVVQRAGAIFGSHSGARAVAFSLEGNEDSRPATGAPQVALPGAWDPFEVGLTTVLANHLGRPAAREVVRLLIEGLGDRANTIGEPELTHTFPRVDQLASADLARLGFDSITESLVRQFAAGVADASIPLGRDADFEVLREALERLCGMAYEPARYIALRAGLRDVPPSADPMAGRSISRAAGDMPRVSASG